MSHEKVIISIDKLNNLAFQNIHSDPREGQKLSQKSFELSEPINYKKGLAYSKLSEGWCLLQTNSYEDSLKALEYSLSAFQSIGHRIGEMKTLNAFGVLYSNISNYETAMGYLTRALELSKETGNDERLVASYINIGSLYTELGSIDKAFNCYNQSLEILENTKNQSQLCACLINIGDNYESQDKLEEALAKYTESLKIAKEISNKTYESDCLTSIGKIYQKTGKIFEAEDFHKRSLLIADSLRNQLSKVECLTNLATLYNKQKNFKKSIEYHLLAIEISKNISSNYYIAQNYLGISNTYQNTNEIKKSLEYFKLYHNTNASLQNEKIDLKLMGITAHNRIQAAEKEAEIHRIRNIELQDAFDRVSFLNKIGRDITSSLDLEIVMTNIYKNLSSFISADLFGIALYLKDSEEVNFKYSIVKGKRISNDKKIIPTEGSISGWVIRNRKHLFINDLQNEYKKYVPKLIGPKTEETQSLIVVPLIIKNEPIGIITVQSYQLNAYTNQHLEIIQAVGAYSAIAIENSRVHEEINKLNKLINSEKKALEKAYLKIDKLANHDTLTELPNRRLFTELLKQELRQSECQKTKTAVLFIDLDDFKPVNDTLGHDAGDKVLQMVSQRFVSTLRESDTIARIGGDEFAALICNVKNKNDIQKIAGKIIDKFKNPFKVDNSKFQIGISVGISVYPDDDNNIDGLLKKADTAMYKIKTENKNSFVFFNELD